MRLVAEVRERLRALLFRAREDRELDEELRFHLEMEVEEKPAPWNEPGGGPARGAAEVGRRAPGEGGGA